MILESEQEQEAFDLICMLVFDVFNRDCVDVEKEYGEIFKDCYIEETHDDFLKPILRHLESELDILSWFEQQAKFVKKSSEKDTTNKGDKNDRIA
jgi:hypothetical protein